ncbi:MAG TPA: ABC transporter permease, partial [Methylomirabilota bacterium]|nr:ABC transporter permease [Methylomirabilota bacterium]
MVDATLPLEVGPPSAARRWMTFGRRLARRRTSLFGLLVVVLVVITALAAPLLSPFDPVEQDIGNRLKPPGWRDQAGVLRLLGTDHLGRDLLARVMHGARPALMVGFAAVLLSGVLGMVTGLLSGYFGGWTDDILMRLGDVQLAFPF